MLCKKGSAGITAEARKSDQQDWDEKYACYNSYIMYVCYVWHHCTIIIAKERVIFVGANSCGS